MFFYLYLDKNIRKYLGDLIAIIA